MNIEKHPENNRDAFFSYDASFNLSAGASPCPTDCAVSNIFSAKMA